MTEPKPPAAATSSEELAVRARAGSRGSFDELVVRHRPRLVAFLTRRVADAAEAEDIAQETFLRAFDHLDRYDPDRPFLTWLFAIGKNVAINHGVARSRRDARHERIQPVAVEVAHDDASDIWPRAAAVLSPAAYQVLWLRYAQGLTVREIATQLARSSVAIKVTLFRARRRLLQEVR
jgi:RNA polymerase sigma-70 factor (ECF subfamily)